MNIETLSRHAETFTREVVDTGFKRDLEDFISSLPASQSNILQLREIAEKTLTRIDLIYSGDLPGALEALLPNPTVATFTSIAHDKILRELFENSEIPLAEFFSQLSSLLTTLNQQLKQNSDDISAVEEFIAPYVSVDTLDITAEDLAIISIIYNNSETITSLKGFTKTVATWNKILPIYHQLLKSESPEDIEIVEIQNGSIDLIVNLNVDVALDLAELFKVGFQVFGAHLSYKKIAKPFIDSYYGNKKLISGEDAREVEMLGNIGKAVKNEILQQHKAAKKTDAGVSRTAVPKKIEQVVNLVTSHIVQGNDIKVLALPSEYEIDEDDGDETYNVVEELRMISTVARRDFREVSQDAQEKLLLTYGKINDEISDA